MPGYDWTDDDPTPEPVTDATAFPVTYEVEFREASTNGTEGEVVATVPAGGYNVYTDIPGDSAFRLDNSWELNASGTGGKLFKGTEYNFFFSFPGGRLEKAWLESNLGEDDCQKVGTGEPESNKLKVKLKAEVVRIPLGLENGVDVKAGQACRFWIPSKGGGVLQVYHSDSNAEMRLYHKDLETPYSGVSERDEKALPKGDAAEVVGTGGDLKAYLNKDEFEWFYVLPSHPGKVTVQFFEEIIPRDKDESPMFPYHFYYWPVNKKEPWDGDDAVLRRYARAFGVDEKEVVWWEVGGEDAIDDGQQDGHDKVVELAQQSKYEDQDLGHFRPKQPDWAGHCHNAAPASIFFKEPPKEGKEHNGQKFNQGELEFFQTEFAGNYCSINGDGWSLPSTVIDVRIKWKDGTREGEGRPRRPVNVLAFLKPSDATPSTSLEDALYDKFHYEDGDYVQFDRENAQETVQRVFQQFGSEDAFNQAVAGKWFEAGLSFVDAVRDLLGDKGDPAMGDIRSNGADAGPSAIWNNCLMYTKVRFEEAEDAEDEKDLLTITEHYFNIDNFRMIGTETCKIEEGDIVPKNFWGRRQEMRARYTDGGTVERGHEKNRFNSFKFFMNDVRGEVYMVTYLSRMRSPVATSRLGRDDFGGGNPYIDTNPLVDGVIELRDKYAS